MAIQRVHSKWAKTTALLRSELLQPHIPETWPFRRETVRSMLDQYGMVYVKPDRGTFGHGVMRIDRTGSQLRPYQFQLGNKIRRFSTFEAMYKQLVVHRRKRRYLVQKGIHLLEHEGRRFDLRVMVQQNEHKEWEATGVIGRLGLPSKIVTNYHSGATPMPFEKLMSSHMTEAKHADLCNRLSALGIASAKQLQTFYPNIKEIGVDVAIDNRFHPWILEVNTLPDPFLFRKLEDRTVFRKIYRYAVGYGRFKRSKR